MTTNDDGLPPAIPEDTLALPNEERVELGRRLGRRAPSNRACLSASKYFTGTPLIPGQPTVPRSVDHFSKVAAWNLGANNKFGTCGPTGLANFYTMCYAYVTGEQISVTDDAIFSLYEASGNPGFNPATGADDNGVDLNTMLTAALGVGLDITHADGTVENVRPLGFAALSVVDLDELKEATALFGGALLGSTLQVAQQGQSVWDYVPGSAAWGGHCTLGAGYSGDSAPGSADEEDISWAEVYGTTDTFVLKQLEEAYAIILPVAVGHPRFRAAFNLDWFKEDYEAITGSIWPETAS